MRWSRTLLATLRDAPQDAEIESHKLMIRAGLMRKLGGGLYTFMPLGLRVLHKIEAIVREEMDRAGALEILMPALQPAELWEKTGRWTTMGAGMFRLKDRKEAMMTLGPTHEEVVTDLITREISSYRQLPLTVYQIQTKFRDEIRPRFGLMRSKEFLMKDAYSFDISLEAADASYKAMFDAYVRIFARCGLDAKPVEADTGDIGGNCSHEFMVLAPSGEDGILDCAACGYAANQERAERKPPAPACTLSGGDAIEVPTPDSRTIEEVAACLSMPQARIIKALVYMADSKPVMVLVAGDRELSEPKLKRFLGCKSLVMATDAEMVAAAGPVGFVGPVGIAIPVYADLGLKGACDMAAGANREGFHLVHVDLARDAKVAAYEDLVTVTAGDSCPRCGAELGIRRGIEVGHVFKLGTKYTQAFDSRYLDEKGKNELMVMGCYGIGVSRTLQAVIEQNHDENGILWPASVAPYQVTILLLDPADPAVVEAVDTLEAALQARGIDVFVDDREERPGVKFKDADLVGFPIRVVAGAKSLAKGGFEVKRREEKESLLTAPEATVDAILNLLNKTV